MLDKILLIIGIFEILLGIIFYLNKNKSFLDIIYKIYTTINKNVILEEIEDKYIITKSLGQTIAIEGGIYFFLGSVSLYTKMSFFTTIVLIVIIEITFFNIIKSNLKKYKFKK